MSQIVLSPNAAGTAQFTIAAPGTNTNRTLTLPDATGTLPMLQQGTSIATTSGTSVSLSTSIPSWAKRLTVMLAGVSTSGTANLLLQVGTGGVATTTGYNSTSNMFNQSNSSVGASATAGFVVYQGLSAASVTSGHMTITNVSGNLWVASHTAKISTTQVSIGGGDVTLSGVLNMLVLTTVNGTDTFDAGSINIMWEG